MECPILPFDTEFEIKDMLHTKFDTLSGPLWRVQLITEKTMDSADLGFGPELQAIIEDDSPVSTRWRYFLRYFQGKVNQADIDQYNEEEEGFRSFILMTFHPSITDTTGSLHLLKQFLIILDGILEQDSNSDSIITYSNPIELHYPVESLLPSNESGFHFGDLFPMAQKVVGNYVLPRKSPLEDIINKEPSDFRQTQVLRGWLTEAETSEIEAMMEEDDASLHGVILAAGLIALSRIVQSDKSAEYPPKETVHLRATNQTNLRQYCPKAPKHGCLTTFYEDDYTVPPVTDRAEFWRLAHDLTIKHNAAKGGRQPLKMLRVYNKMFSFYGENSYKDMDKIDKINNDMGVAVYGDLCHLFRRDTSSMYQSMDTWSKPLNVTQRNPIGGRFSHDGGAKYGFPFHSLGSYFTRKTKLYFTILFNVCRSNACIYVERRNFDHFKNGG